MSYDGRSLKRDRLGINHRQEETSGCENWQRSKEHSGKGMMLLCRGLGPFTAQGHEGAQGPLAPDNHTCASSVVSHQWPEIGNSGSVYAMGIGSPCQL